MALACIALGSNLGDRAGFLDRAVELLGQTPGVQLIARSSNLETEPVDGPPGQGRYLNGAAVVRTDLTPQELLACLQRIEAAMGRPAVAQRVLMGPRTIDLDLLLYDARVIDEPSLQVPHPRMHERRFVLAPLAQIAPGQVHPVLGLTVAQMLDRLPASAS